MAAGANRRPGPARRPDPRLRRLDSGPDAQPAPTIARHPGVARGPANGLAASAALLLIAVSICALVAVATPSRRRPTRQRLLFAQSLWLQVRDHDLPPEAALGELLNQLIGTPGHERPFLELAAAADRRERITTLSAVMLGIGVVLVASVLGLLLLG